MKRILALACALVAAGVAVPAAGERLNTPIYDPVTKSYFELRKGVSRGLWKNALAQATRLTYKGVHGRLAMLPNQETSDRVYRALDLRHLQYPYVWFGMRFWCKHRKLMWSNGDIHPLKGYSNWRSPWYRTEKITCRTALRNDRQGYMPLSLETKTGLWMATGPGKGYDYFLVEYPTGKE
ncbi:MAG: hypothetical protein H6907_18170 [Hyphomicrobiales bacterium]|nr:hypothetical protein [Hyphomicrobiales bacterium]MCP5373661.1 hypothetical protein [Hyphomicrobiales bacterium]